MTNVNLLPLLERLAGESDELLRRSLLTAVTAMAQSGASEEHMPTIIREAWAEKVILHPLPRHCSTYKCCRYSLWNQRCCMGWCTQWCSTDW